MRFVRGLTEGTSVCCGVTLCGWQELPVELAAPARSPWFCLSRHKGYVHLTESKLVARYWLHTHDLRRPCVLKVLFQMWFAGKHGTVCILLGVLGGEGSQQHAWVQSRSISWSE